VMGASVDPPEGVISLTDVVDTPAGTTLVAAISPYEPGTMRVTGAMSGAGASLDVLDSFGLPLPKSNDTSGTLGDMTIMSFEVSPGPGDGEQYRLVAGSTEEATFFGSFVRLDRPELSLELDEYRAAVGSPIPVRASLLDSGGAALTDFAGTMDADLQGLDPQSVTLTDDGTGSDAVAGDGIFSGDIPAVAAADVYHLVVTASGTSATEGVVFRRVIEGQLVSAAHASVLGYMGPTLVDTNGNGLAETLLLEFQTDIAAAGEYAVTGRLLGGGQDYPVSAGVVATTVPSSPVVGLAIPASVVQLAANAQLELRELVMLDTDGVESFVPFGDVVLGAFDPAQFEPLPGPVLQNLTPNTGGFLGGGTVLLRGEHLEHVEVVKFGGREAGFEVLTGDTLSVVVPPWVDPPAGGIGAARELPKKKKVVRVVVDGPTGSAVLTKAFTYLRWE